MWLKILSVFASGMMGLWQGIPLGFVFHLHPVVTASVASAGSISVTLVVALLGERVRTYVERRRARDTKASRERLVDRVWKRYGLVGLGLLAPGITGAPAGVAIGLYMRAPLGRLLTWSVIGIVLWAAVMTAVGAGVRQLAA